LELGYQLAKTNEELERVKKQAQDYRDRYVATMEQVNKLYDTIGRTSLFGEHQGVPGQVYPIVYSDVVWDDGIGRDAVMLYLGKLKFKMTSVAGRDGKVRRLKKEFVRKFSIDIGYNPKMHHLVALNYASLPGHPNINGWICSGDLGIPPRWTVELHKMRMAEITAEWEELKPKLMVTLSTADIANGFHRSSVDDELMRDDIYDTEDASPIWTRCNSCDETENICAECNSCQEHCSGMRCGGCGELYHGDDFCNTCERCPDCDNDNHCSCIICGEAMESDDLLECDTCESCHVDAGHHYCDYCEEHLNDGEGSQCDGCGHYVCERHIGTVTEDGTTLCDNCLEEWGPDTKTTVWHS
jgi:hypothetical protein